MTLTIEGTDFTGKLLTDTLNISHQMNARSSCSFALKLLVADTRPDVGQDILVKDDSNNKLFSGIIENITEEVPLGTYVLILQVEATDFHRLLDYRLVAEVYENATAGSIITDMVTDHLSGEGITTTHVETGPTLDKVVLNYVSMTEAINLISELTGYGFYIDPDKDMHFFARETNTAPFSITDAQYNCRRLTVRKTTENYRNVQYIRAGRDVTSDQTENYKGDGTNRVFTVSFPIATVPMVKVNTVTKTVGIRGVETGKDWYWNKDDKQITQDSGGTVLTSSDTLSVTYKGFFPIIISSEDTAEISSRVSVEGGQGRYEAIEDDQSVDSINLAQDKAIALLRRYGRISKVIDIETDKAGLFPGQLITITVSDHNLNSQYLIESVETNYIDGVGFRFSVKALSGESFGGWIDFFQKLATAGRRFVIRENEVLILLRQFPEILILIDTLSVNINTAFSDVGLAEVGTAEVATL